MSLPYAKPKWIDGDFTTTKAVGLPVFDSPIPSSTTQYTLTQEFQIFRNNFAALALGTAHPDYPTFLLVDETEERDLGGGVIQWKRVYAATPASFNEPEMFSYSFIGMTTSFGSPPTLVTRNRRVWTVKTRVQYDYFQVPSTGVTDPILGGSPFNITTDGDIPTILDMQYVLQGTLGGATYGGTICATDQLNLQGAALPTWPTSDQYRAMISDALQNGWNSTRTKVIVFPTDTLAGSPPSSGHNAGVIDTVNSVLGGRIPVEPSRLVRWQGNIFQRSTRYALAQ